VESLASGIAQLAADASGRRRLADLARLKIEQDYSFEKRMHRVAALYNRLLGRSVPSVNKAQLVSA
jgi:hypothetical protein